MRYFVCVEKDAVVSICNYEPNVPKSVKKIEISKLDYEKLQMPSYYFDVTTSKVEENEEIKTQLETESTNQVHLDMLNNSDWMVLRHLREKALGIETSLTDAEYLALEEKRELAAKSILSV